MKVSKFYTIFLAINILLPTLSKAEIQLNDAYVSSVDNDEDAEKLEGNLTPQSPLEIADPLTDTAIPKVFLTLEEISPNLSILLEQKFDTFILINTAESPDPNVLVPSQHLRVLSKQRPGSLIFKRDSKGSITGVEEQNTKTIIGIPKLVPISSGRPGATSGIRTFSGIFRPNLSRMKTNFSSSPEAPMSYQTYIDFQYSAGHESGIAVHGTPSRFRYLLGKQRASHGCARTFPEIAKALRSYLMQPEQFSKELPAFDNLRTIPSAELQNGQTWMKPGINALIIIFNGYNNPGTNI